MLDTNINFQEEYKSLDALCKDLLNSHEGVSEYIRCMEAVPYKYYRFLTEWNNDYQQLKHMRWMRNQLAHEHGTLNSDLCTEDDINWLNNFQRRILRTEDPLAAARKIEISETTRRNTQTPIPKQTPPLKQVQHEEPQTKKKEVSLWSKFITKIKNLFLR